VKRIFQHPARDMQPTLWRSSKERENSESFNESLLREFPAGADRASEKHETQGLSRRDFLRLTGASAALAGIGLSACRRPEAYLVPFTRSAEWTIPGKFLYYATTMPAPAGAIPLIVTTSDGRPTKIEGNPLHPMSNGSTDAFAQASLLDLYNPYRSKAITLDGKEVASSKLDSYLAYLREEALSNGGEGMAIVVERVGSPTRDRLRDALLKEFPKITWVEYEPLSTHFFEQACNAALGQGVRPIYDFKKADIIVALDADFLNPSVAGLGLANGFYARRNPDQEMNRLYAVENHYSLTGGMADHRLRLQARQLGALTAAMALLIGTKTHNSSLKSLAINWINNNPKIEISSKAQKWVSGVVEDLMANQGKSLVIAGVEQSVAIQLMVLGMNAALGNFGTTLKAATTGVKPTASLKDLSEAIEAGSIKRLLLFQVNPVYTASSEKNWADLVKSVPETLHLSLCEEETSKVSRWHVPAAHYLECWSDARSLDGTLCAVQPMILPLWNGCSELEILHALLGQPRPEGPALIRETFNSFSKDQSDSAWNNYLHEGFLSGTAWPLNQPSWNDAAVQKLATPLEPQQVLSKDDFECVFLPSSSVYDGRYSGNSWLQETPDFVTKLTWDNALLMSPADAKRLHLSDGDMVRLSDGQHSVDIAILTLPGHVNGSVSAALGYGRKNISHIVNNVGFNVYPLRTDASPRFRASVSIKPLTGKKYIFAQTQEHHNMEGRDLVREGTVERYKEDPTFAQTMGMDGHIPPNIGLYTRPPFTAQEQWGMSVDLNTCIGCNACLLACQAENNVPVVGKDQVRRGRDMAWIRIDRWFASPDGSDENPEMLPQAIMCQQCDNAPCETVCPVNATVHSEDGLNLMAYNRCIGTRYCANNCPWKVRRFNFFDYNLRPLDQLYYGPLAPKGMADSLKMSKNPNVTVRMRGVMEKCTFCLQRIEEAKIGRLVKAGASDSHKTPIAPFKTACQQACPSESIVFGNIADSQSAVSKRKKSPRDYTMLKYLNARPRITYLARIKNPNVKMPDADRVGLANGVQHHEASGEHADVGPTHFDQHGMASPQDTLPVISSQFAENSK
jgi:molybdopterin-containing oxidoreductase family iron-sulfur binding subunit